jgi:hypothetical protein
MLVPEFDRDPVARDEGETDGGIELGAVVSARVGGVD